MYKKFLAVSLVTVLALSTVACSNGKKDSKEEKTTSSATETTTNAETDSNGNAELGEINYEKLKSSYYGTVTLADYKDFVVYESDLKVSKEEVQKQIDAIMSSGQYTNYKKNDETVATDKSVANIDYVGYIKVDGEDYQFQGGTGEGYDLNLGNSTFVPGFAEGVVGMKVGEKKDVNIVFPAEYGTTKGPNDEDIELSNKEVRFEVTLNYLSDDIGLTDEFVKEKFASFTGATNVEEFEKYFEDFLLLKQVGESGAFEEFVKKCEFTPNEENLKKEAEAGINNLKTSIEQNSLTMEDYLEQYQEGKKEEDFVKEYEENLKEIYKTYSVICALGESQKIELTQTRFEELFGQIAAQNGYENQLGTYAEFYKTQYGTDPLETFPIQFLYQDVMQNTIANNLEPLAGDRPVEEPTKAE